jgi:hypothetical protein
VVTEICFAKDTAINEWGMLWGNNKALTGSYGPGRSQPESILVVALNTEEQKAGWERHFFEEFARRLNLSVRSIESRRPPEPDVLCTLDDQTKRAFELAEICSRNLAKDLALALRDHDHKPQQAWPPNPTEEIILDKLGKMYQSDAPIDLLFYSDGRLVTPDEHVVATLLHVIRVNGRGPFGRVWYCARDFCSEIVP